jgi:signal transduction histidine kinase/ActR/RegA family two-component response regulator
MATDDSTMSEKPLGHGPLGLIDLAGLPESRRGRLLFWAVGMPLLVGVYVGAAKIGLSLAPDEAKQVTAVWPPAGIALAAVLLLGYRVWPAIALGAFIVNVTTPNELLSTACGIAAGNTLEALAGAWLLRSLIRFDGALGRMTDALALIVLGAGLSTALAATIGVASLCLSGAQPWSAFASLWGLWWLGDAMGGLIVTPFILTWVCDFRRPRRLAEAGVLLALLLIVAWLGFGPPSISSGGTRGWAYCMFPLIMWAAVRFGQRGTTAVTIVAAALAILSTAHGLGPFGGGGIPQRLLTLQLFLGVVATSALLLSAVLAERERLQQELRLRLDQLRETDRRKDEFLAMLAHELRNPLAPIQNALEILALPGASEETVAQAEAILGRQVHHLTRLVDDLLDIARISRGKIELRKERVALEAVVARAVEAARPLIDSRQHELTVSLPPEPLTLDADPTRIAQVISNLLNNAAKYSDSHGHIWLTGRRDHDRVAIHVRDQGIGITPELLPTIFDLFVQADRGRDRTHGGMGIGLTLVRRLVELHGGTVEVASAGTGRGSEFTIRLPLASVQVIRPTSGAAPSKIGVEHAPSCGPILVVDDNVDAARTLEHLLRSRGHEAHALFDGATALAWAETRQPAVAILDIGMPQMDGYELAQRLRGRFSSAELFLVALSGWGQDEDRRRSAEAGFQAHLVKPVELGALEQLFARRYTLSEPQDAPPGSLDSEPVVAPSAPASPPR